ncbi:MAG: hypothetical protein F9K44_02355 [Hyphomicrobiaceae bacterium]|nr:MAG: hypothetical protein F9K44_02355 [Hyphomicrobiaceae bacterium]
MHVTYPSRSFSGVWPMLAAIAAGLLLAACASFNSAPEVSNNPAAGCVDDSKQCIDRRMTTLKAMVSDPKRTWVFQQESPASYATGVKLFAYRATRSQLTCTELSHGRQETAEAAHSLKSGSVPGMNDSRLAQVRDMSSQVSKELGKEFDKACKSPTEAKKGYEARARR